MRETDRDKEETERERERERKRERERERERERGGRLSLRKLMIECNNLINNHRDNKSASPVLVR